MNQRERSPWFTGLSRLCRRRRRVEGGGGRATRDAPGCKDPTKSSRFRPAKKPEHHGKQCCARRKCMEWAGHRDLEKEKSARTKRERAETGGYSAQGAARAAAAQSFG